MKICDKENCSGCGICSLVCKKNAIIMQEDDDGFIFPVIDETICVSCNLCYKRCPVNHNKKRQPLDSLAIIGNNNSLSASGGVFATIATRYLQEGSYVYAATLSKKNKKFIVKHQRIKSVDDLKRFTGSIYSQSDITPIIEDVKEKLILKKKVLFCGTPCQVQGIKNYVGDDNDNLLTIDLFCHGVPSNKMFNDYLIFLEDRNKRNINCFTFRDKKRGWGLFPSVLFDNGKRKIYANTSSYYRLFLSGALNRTSCYNCRFADNERVGDLSIGDFWGSQEFIELQNRDKKNLSKTGISAVLVNTELGKSTLYEYEDDFSIYSSNIESIAEKNDAIMRPTKKNAFRESIMQVYRKEGYTGIEQWFRNQFARQLFFSKLKNIVCKK
ncbi:MAG: Coenzyme F420 hydrogenase/dehydrogenase, beta subunit C-terminal domain [Eubacteriales bacterium]|nr:Coenzyme F420 hydrogenase/dehydrogenase, beta subunit C-terminal domain [Eubacteriales bacterium]